MNLRKRLIKWLLRENETIVEMPQKEVLEYMGAKVTGKHGDEIVVENSTEPKTIQTSLIENGGGAVRNGNSSKKRHSTVIVAGESSSTTGVVKRDKNNRYSFYYYIPSEKKSFCTSSNSKQTMLEILERFNQSDKTKESFDKIREEVTGNDSRHMIRHGREGEVLPKNIHYSKRDDVYYIRKSGVQFGYFENFEKAVYVNKYLKYKDYPIELNPKNLCGKLRVRKEEYYQMMRTMISTDREYMIFNKEGIYSI